MKELQPPLGPEVAGQPTPDGGAGGGQVGASSTGKAQGCHRLGVPGPCGPDSPRGWGCAPLVKCRRLGPSPGGNSSPP